jgi:O-antigen/teichoic acid export membrane protein
MVGGHPRNVRNPGSLTKITSELFGGNQHDEARKLSQWVSLLILALNALFSAAILFWGISSPEPQRTLLCLIAIFVIPNALSSVMRSTLWGREQYGFASIMTAAGSVAQLLLIGLTALQGWGVPGFLVSMLFPQFIQLIGLFLILKISSSRNTSFPKKRDFSVPDKQTIHRYFAFFVPSTLALIIQAIVWQRSEVFFLEQWSTRDQVGFYSLAYTMVEMLLLLGWALINGFLPAISKDYGAGNWDSIRTKARQGLTLAFLFSVPLSFGGWITVKRIIVLMYSEKMLPSVPVVQILLSGLLFGVVAALLGIMIIATGRMWLHVGLGIVLAILNIALDVFLIPKYGAFGGAIANTSSQIVHCIILIGVVMYLYNMTLPWRTFAGIGAVGVLTTYLAPQFIQSWLPGVWGLLVAIGLGGGLYLVAIWMFGYLKTFSEPRTLPV